MVYLPKDSVLLIFGGISNTRMNDIYIYDLSNYFEIKSVLESHFRDKHLEAFENNRQTAFSSMLSDNVL